MKTVLFSLLLGTSFITGTAQACAFHGDGFGMGAFGTQWTPYDSELLEEARRSVKKTDDADANDATASGPRSKPAFASAASRAAESAKARTKKDDEKSENASAEADESAN